MTKLLPYPASTGCISKWAASRRWLRPRLQAAMLLALAIGGQAQAQIAAKSADSFVESIGINTHWQYGTYSNYTALKTLLVESGIRYIRDGSGTSNYGKYNELYATYGIRTNVLLGRRYAGNWPQPLDLGQIGTELSDVKGGITTAAIASLEAPNEYDISHGSGESNWVTKIQNYTKDTYTTAKADAVLRDLPLIGPSLTSEGAFNSVGNLETWIDYANIHPYQSDRWPGTGGWGDKGYGSLDWNLTYLVGKQMPGAKRVQATECGYHNDVGEEGLSEEAEGKYTARMYAEFFRRGIARSYKYELLNQGTDGDKEKAFGLLRKDLTPKPAFRAVKNLIAVLSDKGAAFTPASLNYTLSGSTSNVRQMLFQKRNGDFYLMLWLEVPSWDVNANVNLYPAAQAVTLTVPSSITAATKYELNNNADLSNAAVAISNSALSLAVSDRIMIVKLTSGPVTPPPTTTTFSGTYKLTARHSGKVLDVSEVSTAAGAQVHQWEYVGGANQQWIISAQGNGTYKLMARHSGKVLDVNGGSKADGAKVQQWNDTGSNAQRWKIEASSDGYYRLTNVASGKVLDVAGGTGASANGVKVQQWTNYNAANQQWKLEAVSTTAARTSAAFASSNDPQTDASLLAYPNPNHGDATLLFEAHKTQRTTVYVHNQQGTLVSLLTVPLKDGKTDFHLPSTFAPGMYYIQATVDGRKQSFTLKVE
ncbi:RICIN domain-containing protein [Hymenobacter weizhouensis]|uniref:RICIN domain-containing protein n=1 Tax=Hymenobacter sp. YIM 151500-1 TaxID=2987689 RepID=UPI002227ACEF|nr:RICIN domain-containing protein [Hymenobacter sp. YIM 151500-1]UYZ62146.1 RICIN domain-containing protein [Hymenobacter sp. YIM 151500-1]